MSMTVKKTSIPHMTNRLYRGAKVMKNLALIPAGTSLGAAAMEASSHSLPETVAFASIGFVFLKVVEKSINVARANKIDFLRIKCRAMRLRLTQMENMYKKLFPNEKKLDYSEQKNHLTNIYDELNRLG